MKKLAAIYARVSSLKQKEGETVQSQISSLLSLAKQQNFTIPEDWIFKDEGFSGSTLQRPSLDELRVLIHDGEINAVLVYSPDRLSRKYAHQLLLEMEFEKCATELIFFNTPRATNAEEQLSLHFKSIFAEYERVQIAERCRRGRLYKARQGNISVLPQAPYGYCYNKKNGLEPPSYSIVKEKADVVKKIYSLYSSEWMSISDIIRQLHEKGIKSPGGNLKWHSSTIRDILRNPAYTGTAYFGRTEKVDGFSEKIYRTKKGRVNGPPKDRKAREKNMWTPIPIPEIIDEHIFLRAQERLDVNKQLASRNTKELSILQGLLICEKCGSPYYKKTRGVLSNGNKISYYCCSNRLKSGDCRNRSFRLEELDKVVWEHITGLLKNPSLIEEEIQRRAINVTDDSKMLNRRHEVEKEIVRLVKARDKLLDAFQDGECLTIDELRKRIKMLDQKKSLLEKELQGMQAEVLLKEQNRAIRSTIEHFQKSLDSSHSLSTKEKQKVLRILVDKVILGQEIEIHHCIPITQNSPLKPDRQLRALP